jgi:hypothetical protein
MQHAANETGAVMEGTVALIGIPGDGNRTVVADFSGAKWV